jgi:2-keto-4-pentenoate hydratase
VTTTTDVAASALDEAARRLAEADRTRTPCAPVRDLIGGTDVVAAYAVQTRNRDAAIAAGRRVVGRKIGLTAPAVQRQLGVDRPDFGYLYDDMDVSGSSVGPGRLLQPKIEAEIAFELGIDLDGPVDVDGVRAAIRRVRPALEIVDSRVAGWDITFGDTVADNASAGLYVLGPDVIEVSGPEELARLALPQVAMTLTVDGEPASSGRGADCLGDPVAALHWLAIAAHQHGDPLRAGQVVLSGALGPMVPVAPGRHVEAEISGIGAVAVRFDREAV